MSEKKKKLPYFSDVVLFKRVDKYLDDNIDKQMIDKEEMVDDLRNTYKEYLRRNRNAFRAAVFKAYYMINQNVLEVTQDRSNNCSDAEGPDDLGSPENECISSGPTDAACHMVQSYLQGLNSMTSPAVERSSKNSNSELINISSDEGEGEPEPKRPAHMSTSSNNNRPVPQKTWQRPPTGVDYHAHHCHPREAPGGHEPKRVSTVHINHQTPSGDKRLKKSSKRDKNRSLMYPALTIFPTTKKAMGPQLPDAIPEIGYEDFGGYPKVLQSINDLVLHFHQNDIYSMLGVTPPRGFILHGPPGCGKTLLAHAVAGELRLPLVKVSGPELIGGISGESEERIRKIFLQAKQQVPCILFIDEIDVISQMRENARKDMERRVVSQLIVSLDDLNSCEEGEELIVIGATNRVEELDPSLRRAGRFDKEVCIGIPDRAARKGILAVLCRSLKMSSNISVDKIAELTPGFVAADLKSLISEAAVAAVKRLFMEQAKARAARKTKNSSPKILNKVPIDILDDEKPEADKPENGDEVPKTTKDAEVKGGDVAESPMEKDEDVAEPDSSHGKEDKSKDGAEKDKEDKDDAEPDSSHEKEDKSKDGAEEAMEVDGVTSNDKESDPADGGVSSARIVIENGEDSQDKKSEDIDSCVIIEDGKIIGDGISKAAPMLSVQIEMEDLMSALKTTQPSAKREGFATVPDVTWDDIGSLKDVRDELTMSIMMPVKYPDEFTKMGIDAPSGIMLWGPPGCGKTLLAKAIANEANINFISVKGPELLNMYVGESEKAVRTCFQRARNSQPCVIFFDEIDALCPRRSDSSEGSVSSRVVNQVLTEMDGVEGRKGVFLMAASNRPDMVDPAVLRPGRLDKIVKVGLPNAQDRVDILRAITKNGTKPPFDKTVSLETIANKPECEGYSGADLAALVKEASILALTNHLTLREANSAEKSDIGALCVSETHFEEAMKKIKPSVHVEERKRYERLEKTFSSATY